MNQRFIHLSSPSRAARKSLRRGIGMLEVLILIAVMSSLLVAGFMQWRVKGYETTSRNEQIKLTQADAAILAFATVAFRLPCPDTNRDGLEDCGATAQKGWLPTTTLRLAGADPGIHAGQLRYLVQRGSPAIDLASGADDWRPLAYDSNAVSNLPSNYAGTPIQTLSDMCSRLVAGSATPFTPGYASVASPVPRLVAYALAHPGTEDDDGDGDLFDGQNTLANASQMEPSDRRSALGLYDDVVFERSIPSVRAALGCDLLNNSIDATSLAADAVDAVKDMRDGNIADGIKAVAWAAASALLSALTAVNTGLGIASDAGNAGVDAAICAASLGLAVNACAAIGIHATAAAFGGGEIAANIISVALSLTAVGLAGTALGVADSNGTTPPQACPAPGVNPAIALLTTQIQNYEADLVTLNTQKTAAVTAKANAVVDLNTKVAQLRNIILNIPPFPVGSTSPLDAMVNTLMTNSGNLLPVQVAFEAATAQRDNAQDSYNSAAADVIRYQNMVDNRSALTVTTQASLATASQTLATYRSIPGTSTTTIANQEREVFKLQSDLQLLTETLPAGQTPTLIVLVARSTAERDVTATNALSAANAVLTTATTNRTNSINSYQSAYSGLQNASAVFYTVTFPPVGTATAVTTAWSSGPAVAIKLSQIFGLEFSSGLFSDSGASAPNADSVFAKPEKLQRQIDSLDARILAIKKILDGDPPGDPKNLRKQLADLSAPSAVPPECNFALNPARPFKPDEARAIVVNVDRKGGTR